MRRCAILPAVTAVLWLAAAHGAEAPTPDQVEQLVAQLGSPAYRERVAANRALDALGDAALDTLRRAAQSADAETRRRAAELVERIERRATTARLLAPATFALDIHQVTRNEAVAEFNKLIPDLLAANKCPDFVEDKGHYFGTDLPDTDKHALIEYLKTF